MAQDQIRVNGAVADGSLVITLDGLEYAGWQGIKCSDKVEVKPLFGLSNKIRGPRGVTAGVYKPDEGELKGPQATALTFGEALKSRAPTQGGKKRISLVVFTITIMFFHPQAKPYLLTGCKVTGWDDGIPEAESADPVTATLKLYIADIERNGIHL